MRMSCYLATRDGVSEHVIYEILLRTPAESLLVFKSVCKEWYLMIKDPNFVKQHYDHHVMKEQSIGLVSLFEREKCFDIYDLTNINKWCDTEKQNEQLQLNTHAERYLQIKSCNGLVCFHTEYPLHMWNPVTRELITLPKPGIDDDKEEATGCGFGFDATHNQYKVIQLYRRFDSTLGYEVLTLDTNMSWRRPIQQKDVLQHPNFWENEGGQEAIFFEGSLYWHATKHILCFNVTTERFKLIQVPSMKHLKLGSNSQSLVGFDRSLCLTDHDVTHKMLHIWTLQSNCADKENIWKQGCSIDVSCISASEMDTHITPVCSRRKKIYLRYKNGLACFDSESHEFVVPVPRKRAHDYFEFVAYTKSIVCLEDIVGSSFVLSLEPIVHFLDQSARA